MWPLGCDALQVDTDDFEAHSAAIFRIHLQDYRVSQTRGPQSVSSDAEMVRGHPGVAEGHGGPVHVSGVALPPHVPLYDPALHVVYRPLLLPSRNHGSKRVFRARGFNPSQHHRLHQLLGNGKTAFWAMTLSRFLLRKGLIPRCSTSFLYPPHLATML